MDELKRDITATDNVDVCVGTNPIKQDLKYVETARTKNGSRTDYYQRHAGLLAYFANRLLATQLRSAVWLYWSEGR
jgi:hypothetical protein